MKRLPTQNGTEIEEWDQRSTRKLARDTGGIEYAAAEFDVIHLWRKEIASARNISQETKRTVAQLSNFELVLFLNGKRQREGFHKPARRDLFDLSRADGGYQVATRR